MAGIGFELKKLFAKKGIFQSMRAYGFTTIICTGPMLFGIFLILGIMALCSFADVPTYIREQVVSMITYTLLASIIVSSFFSMIVTRYIADALFEEEYDAALPAFWGSSALMMIVGSLLFGIFLAISGATLFEQFFSFILFNELLIVWNSMTFLSAIKDYKGIILSFSISVVVVFLMGTLLLLGFKMPVSEALLISVSSGYGVMMIWNIILLHRYFPASKRSAFEFLHWFDSYIPLALSNIFTNIGMFAHIVIIWFSDIGVHCKGLFYGAPMYDTAALMAYMTTMITTVNFVISVEVNFYPKYKIHYSLYNDKGMIRDIKQSEQDMLRTLKAEIFYTSLKQLLFTATCIALGGYLFEILPIGINETMRGYFRTLCVAYGLYAIGNMIVLLLMYFTDYKGAMISTGVFCFFTVVLTLISLFFPSIYYGFGFLTASVIFVFVAAWHLKHYTKHLPYYILSVQPLVSESKVGPFTKLGKFLDDNLEKITGEQTGEQK